MAADIGTGATILFGTSGWAGNIVSISHGGVGRGKVGTSHLGTVGGRTYIPTDLYEPGELEVEFQVDTTNVKASTGAGNKFPRYNTAAETITFKLPVPTGSSTAASIAGSGFVIGPVEFDNPLDELITGRFTVAFSGNLTHTNAG